MVDLDEVLWEGTTRREIWRLWLADLENATHHTDDYRRFLTGLDDWRPDPEKEVRQMCDYLRDLLDKGQ